MTDSSYLSNKRVVSFDASTSTSRANDEVYSPQPYAPRLPTGLGPSAPKPIIKMPYPGPIKPADRRRNPAIVYGPTPGAVIHGPYLNVSPVNTSVMKQSLKDFVNSTSFANLPEASVISMLKGFVQQHEPHVSPGIYVRPEDLPTYQPQVRKLPLATRTLLEQLSQLEATVPLTRNSVIGQKPMIGATIYIGSPLDGEMIIANESVVSDWLTFTRNAVKENLVQADEGLITSEVLSRVVNILTIPEGRHAFNITYGTPQQCLNPGHTKFRWDSARYPCSVLSCKCNTAP